MVTNINRAALIKILPIFAPTMIFIPATNDPKARASDAYLPYSKTRGEEIHAPKEPAIFIEGWLMLDTSSAESPGLKLRRARTRTADRAIKE
jgi:hypothetical protein